MLFLLPWVRVRYPYNSSPLMESTASTEASSSSSSSFSLSPAYEQIAVDIYQYLLGVVINYEIFDMHYLIKMKLLTMEDLYSVNELPQQHGEKHKKGGDHGSSSSSIHLVTCPSCGEQVGSSRFAPHLAKCIKAERGGSTLKASRRETSSSSTSKVPTKSTATSEVIHDGDDAIATGDATTSIFQADVNDSASM